MTRASHPALPVSCLLAALLLSACTNLPPACRDCHQKCGVLRSACIAECDESLACEPDAGELDEADEEGWES